MVGRLSRKRFIGTPQKAAWRRSLWYSLPRSFPTPDRNTPQKTLESWKQIAAYLDRSERTVRRWESLEGLPIHRRGHQKSDTVFAYKHEIEAWARRRTRFRSQEQPVSRAEVHVPSLDQAPANRY